MDLLIGVITLTILAPVIMIVALAIKLEDGGPFLFVQPRIGHGNRIFKMLKFRSMKVETSDIDGSRSTTPNDARVTKVGKIIRATSIDELPQLFNVPLGEMSLVGPRPHALGSLASDKLFWEIDGEYWQRHALKPGMTGLAQIRGYRGVTDTEAHLTNRLQVDLEYIRDWSPWLDLKILVGTLWVLVPERP
ncbi:exopolysaccharide biosynthesis protein [Erythrobacter aquimaris]|uniref:Exopolysaccharide biosynthesis protein n=1 Tax=Qipengyuania aquimaris TaxID=255984 RepID=A0A6I4TJ92_9SPHN|nr:sugar transferase [Qipengyuania aquimaris]MXO95866.1 exopolysaccharide biosynthesis protein [Qipengyuania aquimaris]